MSTDPVRRLLDQLADPNPRVRRLALVALDDRLTVGCLEPLLEIVQDPDPTVRRLVVRLLETLGDARAIPAVARALGDPDALVRDAASLALRELRGEQATELLLYALRVSDDPRIRRTVQRTLDDRRTALRA